ncbi:AfsR/SARP family transcriptional regulator [Nonomuraea jabiensis]|uniref:AfsR/SARP family transcriptional regulator n=1 Tax=Nonomuraea jabiensis TaxID=882448 RepID=UPI00368E9E3A
MLLSGLLVRWVRMRMSNAGPEANLPTVHCDNEDRSANQRLAAVSVLAESVGVEGENTSARSEADHPGPAVPEAVSTPHPKALVAPPIETPRPSVAQVEVMGPARLMVAGKEVSFSRAEGRALFALLATAKDGESSDAVIDRLWPEDGERGARRLETAVRDINGAMRQATGLGPSVKFVLKVGQRRRLSAAYFDVDWWRFEEAYVQANTAEDERTRREALRRMVALYRGPLLADRDDVWCLPLRQTAVTQAVTAVTRLAELERHSDPDQALGSLRLAVDRIDPYNEMLWCKIMTIEGELGRVSEVRWTYQQLTERLVEIDARPSAESQRTYQRFVK